MEVTVTDPVKEEDSYISYQVNTKVTRYSNPKEQGPFVENVESADIFRELILT